LHGKNPRKPPLTVVATMAETSAMGPEPPRKLGEHGRAGWNRLMAEYQIEDAGGIEVLAQICAAIDRAERLRALIDEQGETIKNRSGVRVHPELKDEAACRAFVVRSLARLGILDEPVKANGRPPRPFGWGGPLADE
jgi:hypothetical protein